MTPHIRKPEYLRLTPLEGRRRLVLQFAGLAYVIQGGDMFNYLPYGPRARAIHIATEILPIEVWAGMFVAVGLMAMLFSVWPKNGRAKGYALLSSISAAWCSTIVLGVFFDEYGTPANLWIAAFWGCLGLLWWAISRVVIPDPSVCK